MLQPKRQKYRKQFRGQMPGTAIRGGSVSFGEYGLKAMSRGWVSARQIESARKAITRYTSKGGKMWIRIFPDKPITKKALGTRMGSGKGDIHEYVVIIKPGRVLFEVAGIPRETAVEAFKKAGAKLSVDVRFADKI